jgi:hypothetical protein
LKNATEHRNADDQKRNRTEEKADRARTGMIKKDKTEKKTGKGEIKKKRHL